MIKIAPGKATVFFDFDNTITTFDLLDEVIENFSVNDKWKRLEAEWRKGNIGSRECLKGQLKGVRVSRKVLDRYLSGIKLDPYFKKLTGLLNAKKIRSVILSDNFDYMLKGVLRARGLGEDFDVYCNRVKWNGDRMVPSFPYSNSGCGTCGHCKRTSMRRIASSEETTFYVGDGLSDRCAAKEADIVFAKSELKGYLKKEGIKHMPFDRMEDIYDYFTKTL